MSYNFNIDFLGKKRWKKIDLGYVYFLVLTHTRVWAQYALRHRKYGQNHCQSDYTPPKTACKKRQHSDAQECRLVLLCNDQQQLSHPATLREQIVHLCNISIIRVIYWQTFVQSVLQIDSYSLSSSLNSTLNRFLKL